MKSIVIFYPDVEDFSIIKPNSTIRPIESLNSDAGVCKVSIAFIALN